MSSLLRHINGQFHDEADGQDYQLGTEWWFDSADPAAVVLRARQPRGEITEWVFARSLVAHGLHAAAGLALLHIEPCESREHVQVTAYFGADPIVMRFPLPAVEEFLIASTRLVALGELAEAGSYTDELAAGVAELMGEWPR